MCFPCNAFPAILPWWSSLLVLAIVVVIAVAVAMVAMVVLVAMVVIVGLIQSPDSN